MRSSQVLAAGIADRDARAIAGDHELVSERVESIEVPVRSEIECGDESRTRTRQLPQIRVGAGQEIDRTRDWETGESLATSIVFGFSTAIARTGPCEKLVIGVGRGSGRVDRIYRRRAAQVTEVGADQGCAPEG